MADWMDWIDWLDRQVEEAGERGRVLPTLTVSLSCFEASLTSDPLTTRGFGFSRLDGGDCLTGETTCKSVPCVHMGWVCVYVYMDDGVCVYHVSTIGETICTCNVHIRSCMCVLCEYTWLHPAISRKGDLISEKTSGNVPYLYEITKINVFISELPFKQVLTTQRPWQHGAGAKASEPALQIGQFVQIWQTTFDTLVGR